uniref:growth/differentiation factor 10-like n=1 Tax=Doryrhamphus excisus TaxID=161450 RepID=UPI0025AE03ED|nr:growth/differentiation factor 10-like [Doryrhamphus excisus]
MLSTHLLVLVFNCFLAVASVRMARRSAQDTIFPQSSSSGDVDRDVVFEYMSKLYEGFKSEERTKEEGNTVRSFRASQVPSDLRTVYHLNLTTLQDSEVILSASIHFLLRRLPAPNAWMCKRFKSPSCRMSATHSSPSVTLLLRATPSGSGVSSESTGSFLGNVTFHPHRRGVWQMKDVTQVIKEARDKGHLLVSVELDLGRHYQRKTEQPVQAYLVVFADDQALAEPNSVAPSLQRYDPVSDGLEPSHPPQILHGPNFLPDLKGRVRREATSIENNELPEVDDGFDGYRKDLWESSWYPASKPKMKAGKQEKRRKNQEEEVQQKRNGHNREESTKKTSQSSMTRRHKERRTQVVESRRHDGKDGGKHSKGGGHLLSFDEQTMRKARRRQWGDTRHQGCSRRNLRVDFADIGWSEWVIEPKAFDAYYCSGTCGFPMPKVVRPSNHATIQSIVRAVGIMSGVPEPCCVPEKMTSLAVLYQEESKDLVLKIYPNMSVQSCSCR